MAITLTVALTLSLHDGVTTTRAPFPTRIRFRLIRMSHTRLILLVPTVHLAFSTFLPLLVTRLTTVVERPALSFVVEGLALTFRVVLAVGVGVGVGMGVGSFVISKDPTTGVAVE